MHTSRLQVHIMTYSDTRKFATDVTAAAILAFASKLVPKAYKHTLACVNMSLDKPLILHLRGEQDVYSAALENNYEVTQVHTISEFAPLLRARKPYLLLLDLDAPMKDAVENSTIDKSYMDGNYISLMSKTAWDQFLPMIWYTNRSFGDTQELAMMMGVDYVIQRGSPLQPYLDKIAKPVQISEGRWHFIFGPTGVGKTEIAKSIESRLRGNPLAPTGAQLFYRFSSRVKRNDDPDTICIGAFDEKELQPLAVDSHIVLWQSYGQVYGKFITEYGIKNAPSHIIDMLKAASPQATKFLSLECGLSSGAHVVSTCGNATAAQACYTAAHKHGFPMRAYKFELPNLRTQVRRILNKNGAMNGPWETMTSEKEYYLSQAEHDLKQYLQKQKVENKADIEQRIKGLIQLDSEFVKLDFPHDVVDTTDIFAARDFMLDNLHGNGGYYP